MNEARAPLYPGMGSLTAKLRGLHRPDRVTMIVLAITAVALLLRFYDLGAKALHHDESLHATYSWYFASNRFDPPYRHDPLMHGPFQFHIMALFFKLFGDSDFTARVPAALTGTALVATPLLLRRYIGTLATVIAALFLALSPSLLYYSRFAREDIYIALWTTLLFIAVWRYLQEGHDRWLALTAATLALSFATKESVYLSVAILLLYLDVSLTVTLLDQRGTKGEERWLEGVFLAPIAWFLAAFWLPVQSFRESRGFTSLPRSGSLLIAIGILALPQLAAAVQIPLKVLGVDVVGETERQVGIITVCALLGAATIVGLLWDWKRWALVAVIFYAITIPLFTTEFLNARGGMASDFWGALDYWLAQQDVARGTQPWFYYVMMVPLYEFLTLVPAIIGGVWLVWKKRDSLAMLFGWWFLGTFAALSYAGEKMPWLVIHLAIPLALMASYSLGKLLPWALEHLRDVKASSAISWAGAAMAGFAFVVAVFVSVRTADGVAYEHPDTPVEPLIYTQTSRQVPDIAKQIYALQKQAPNGQLTVLVDDSEGMAWPWAWYLRHVSGAQYSSPAGITAAAKPNAVILALPGTIATIPAIRDQAAENISYHHRWWFPEDGYRAATWGNLASGLLDGKLLQRWSEFTSDRVPVTALGSLDGEALFPSPEALARGS